MQDFRRIRAWQANRKLTVWVYHLTEGFPRTERYGLTAQMRDTVVSIGANMAEGCGRGTIPDTLRFFQQSFSSATELLHHFITATDVGYMTQAQFDEGEGQLEPIRRMIAAFMARLRR